MERKRKKKKYYKLNIKYLQLIPQKILENFSVIELLVKPNVKGYSPARLKEVISIICTHAYKSDGLARIKMKYLRKVIPGAEKYLEILISNNIIIRSGFAYKGKECFKYRIHPDYVSKGITLALDCPKLAQQKMAAYTDKWKKENKVAGHSIQKKFLESITLASGYKEFIEENYSDNPDQYNAILGAAIRIENKEFFFQQKDTNGRLYHNISNLKKELRDFVIVDDERIKGADLKNFQPLLSTIFLTNPGKASPFTKNPAFAMLLQSLKYSDNEDVKRYIFLVQKGQIYEYLMNEFACEEIFLSRDQVKIQMLRILFARNRMPHDDVNRKCRMIFKDRFPTVHKIFSKVRGSEKGDKFSNFKRFAIILQRIESYLMLDRILKRVYKELPGTIAISIHDSILTGVLTDNTEAIKKIMEEEVRDFVGFLPQIKIEGKVIGIEQGRRKKEGRENRDRYTMLTSSQVS